MPLGVYRDRTKVAPERQRKIDAAVAAAVRRGLKVSNYKPLVAGGGRWKLGAEGVLRDRDGRANRFYGLEENEYEDLLALLNDDLLWAQFCHQRLGRLLWRVASDLETEYNTALRRYGDASANQLRAEVQGDDTQQTEEAVSDTDARVRMAYDPWRAARTEAERYAATLPKTTEEAAAYLATVTVIKN